MIKFEVVVGTEKQVFYSYESACEWFAAQWVPGLVWEFHKYDCGRMVY